MPTGFLSLPAELRNRTYHYTYGVDWDTTSQQCRLSLGDTALLRTCRQIAAEASPVLAHAREEFEGLRRAWEQKDAAEERLRERQEAAEKMGALEKEWHELSLAGETTSAAEVEEWAALGAARKAERRRQEEEQPGFVRVGGWRDWFYDSE